MTRERAIHKIDFSIKAYQNLIDQNVCSGEVLGDGVKGSWESDKAPIQEYQDMIDALKMAKDALQEKPHCIATVTLNDEKMREYCHKAAQEIKKHFDEAFENRGTDAKVIYSDHDTAQCPACGYEFQDGFREWLLPYCAHCGQKLDWRVESVKE